MEINIANRLLIYIYTFVKLKAYKLLGITRVQFLICDIILSHFNRICFVTAAYKGIDTGDGTGTGIAKLQITLTRGDLGKEFKCLVESDALDEPIMSKVTADVNGKSVHEFTTIEKAVDNS